ncbi:MAG: DJ-1/PfpI family protein [Methylobacterium sp.]|uniref:DJ-1/PfpI family protein n=1 Tax=Methylobacterium sp. TaxID=409 RepID=UPI0025DE51A5|nr:DJ-1/PfpI family protein [Methylobacterium sp.]MBX9934901.1 DJ-1/PfpI family protein [Methylobacterium sp.]
MPVQIGLLAFPGVQQLDLTAPFEVFASLPETEVHVIAARLEPVRSATGLMLTPTLTCGSCPPLDVICIPGGVGVNALMQDEAMIAFVRHQARGARYVTSVCTGALVLAAAGLLKGKRATTHWAALDLLAAFGAIPVAERVVRDGNLFTGGGVTAGIDFALTLAAELMGRSVAEATQLALEYAPAPPFSSGTPQTATPDVLATARARLSGSRAERERIVAAITAPPSPRTEPSPIPHPAPR